MNMVSYIYLCTCLYVYIYIYVYYQMISNVHTRKGWTRFPEISWDNMLANPRTGHLAMFDDASARVVSQWTFVH